MSLFDKSFVQMLSLDEAVIFDALFSSVIAPPFYSEVLADLAKEPKQGGPAEKAVAGLAEKTPIMHCYPAGFHTDLIFAELIGATIPLNGQVPRGGAHASVDKDGKVVVVYGEAPETRAFNRWQRNRFIELERDFAAAWRRKLAGSDHASDAKRVKSRLKISSEPKVLDDAYAIADDALNADGRAFATLQTLCMLFGIAGKDFSAVRAHWISIGRPKLVNFAPYSAFCLRVEIFFWLCIDKRLISPDRPSNHIDISYLYYLPFCHVFVSNDKLHARTSPLFLRDDQRLVNGEKLKADLQKLLQSYEGEKERLDNVGVMEGILRPPDDGSLTAELWAAFRNGTSLERGRPPGNRAAEERLVAMLTSKLNAAIAAPRSNSPRMEPDAMFIQRLIPASRGRWRLISKKVADAC